MTDRAPPDYGGLCDEVLALARELLERVGIEVESKRAGELLLDGGARKGPDGRMRISGALVEQALSSTSPEIELFDREGHSAATLGRGATCFNPGSAALKVLDHELDAARPATQEDCTLFARLTDRLPALALQSTCVVPSDVRSAHADRFRLATALRECQKPIVTGTFAKASFPIMRRMLELVRGGQQALRDRPLALFDCCPTAPLSWSNLGCESLLGCAESGIPAQLISVPMAGATAPVTLREALVQQTAENLSGLVLHQLAAPGAPIVFGGCAAAFDMRTGSMPVAGPEAMLLNSTCAQIGRSLGLPTHAYMALSDSKTIDYQAGLETGLGALQAVLNRIDLVSGPGILEFVSCQSLEKLLLDNEACALALRVGQGIQSRPGSSATEIIQAGLSAGQFLGLDHTRRWFRQELHRPGPCVDRQDGETWGRQGRLEARSRAHQEVRHLLSHEPRTDPLPADIDRELDRLIQTA